MPRPCARALDVGCGTGRFTRRLAALATEVVAIDRDSGSLARARALSADLGNVAFVETDFLAWPADGTFDYVAFVASLHHLPFASALAKAADLLRPGGVLAVLGLDRPIWSAGRAWGLIAFPVSRWYHLTRRVEEVGAPIQEPAMTLPEIRRSAADLLPGVRLRRHLMWRYSLEWTKPGSPRPRSSRRSAV